MNGRENAGDDWRIGDWAECIADDWGFDTGCDPKAGDRLIVKEVIMSRIVGTLILGIGLRFIGKPSDRAWHAPGFRKIISDMDDRMVERKATRPVLEPTA